MGRWEFDPFQRSSAHDRKPSSGTQHVGILVKHLSSRKETSQSFVSFEVVHSIMKSANQDSVNIS